MNITTEVGTKPVPVNETDVAALPAVIVAGLAVVRLGTGLFTCRGNALEAPPFGWGFRTAIWTVPPFATSDAKIVAERDVEFVKRVGRLLPFAVTMDRETKFVPVTVSTNWPVPARTPIGERDVTWGNGLGAGLMVNWRVVVVPPPGEGVVTATVAVPWF